MSTFDFSEVTVQRTADDRVVISLQLPNESQARWVYEEINTCVKKGILKIYLTDPQLVEYTS